MTIWLRSLRFIIPLAALTVAGFYLLNQRELYRALRELTDVNWLGMIGISVGIILMVWGTRAVRWYGLMSALGYRPRHITRFYLNMGIALGLGALTPAQLGETSKVFFDDRTRGDRASVLGAFAAERLADFASLIILASLFGPFWLQALVLSGTVAAIMSLGVAKRFVSDSTLLRLPTPLYQGITGLSIIVRNIPTLLLFLTTTALSWALTVLMWHQAFGFAEITEVSIVSTGAIVGTVTLAVVASLVPGGIGVSEAGIAAALSSLGVLASQALVAALIVRALGVISVILGGLHYLLRQGV